MNKSTFWDALDPRSLNVLLAVLEEGSVSGAASRLGISQSAVSHTLERLRARFADPLFVREGRGIAPTSRAMELEAPIRQVLDELRQLAQPTAFSPPDARLKVTIAANDFQRDLLLPALYKRVSEAVSSFQLDIVPSGIPSADLLARGRADLLITPHPPEAADIVQRRLLRDQLVCFFDPTCRQAPVDRASYLSARHILLQFAPGERALLDLRLERSGVARQLALTVSNFSAIPSFMRGTELIATVPSLLKLGSMREFDHCQAPVDTGRFALYLVWHRRMHNDPAQSWLRRQIVEVAKGLSI